MQAEYIIEDFPKEVLLKDGFLCQLRPLESSDECAYYTFFRAIPYEERMFIRHRVDDPRVIREWCQSIDLDRNFPLLAVCEDQIIGAATLHQKLGGWKTHIGQVSAFVRPCYRGRGLARKLVSEIVDLARDMSLQKLEAEFAGEQKAAIQMFAMAGFSHLLRLPCYVKALDGGLHDYILMGLELTTDEEYASAG